MELILRVHVHDRQQDVVVETDPAHTVEDLAQALALHLEVGGATRAVSSIRTGKTLPPDVLVADADLLSGDELALGARVVTEARARPLRAVTADILAGPDSGRSVTLTPGSYAIGRGDNVDIEVSDVSVSRQTHAEIQIASDWSVTVVPRPSTNGVTVNDEPITEPRVVTGDDVIGLGGTRVALRPFERSELEQVDRLGQVVFHRTPYRPPVVQDRAEQKFGPVPKRPEHRGFQLLSVVAPLAAGLAMFAFSRQVQFLALTLISPIMLVATRWEERRSGRRSFSAARHDFEQRLVIRQAELEELRNTERIERLRAAPDLADLVRRAELRTIDLWSRGRNAPDMMSLRLGLGDDRVRFTIDVDEAGDDDLRAAAADAFTGLDGLQNVPVTVDFEHDRVVGVHGDPRLVDGVAASLLVQAACLHSPEDLTIVAAIDGARPFGWLKWLPHARSVTSPLQGAHVVNDRSHVDSLISRLIEMAEFRAGINDRDGEHLWPLVFAVIDERMHPDPAQVARLLDLVSAGGISVVWISEHLGGIPRQATRVLEVKTGVGAAMVGRLWSTDPEVAERTLEVEHLAASMADRVARALAPIRDASTASPTTSIPRVAPLLDVLGPSQPMANWIGERWLADRPYGLDFPIGVGADGPVMLDLVEHGPHALIGGTSGAGKSELLQSMVVGLAAHHHPDRLNFLFIDYKGGASTQVFEGTTKLLVESDGQLHEETVPRLPHAVGYVTNLDAELSLRALTSLQAELNRRMQLMEGRAKDLAEMIEKHPHDAPPSLVIIVDEFATLAKAVPEFVTGVIDIAQRGRSLGIHLILATQRPSGSVNENILANTNLRISLRMLDRAESTAVVGSPEAADIPVPLRGRGYARLGPRELVAFQSAYGGAAYIESGSRQAVLVAPFDDPNGNARDAVAVLQKQRSEETQTQLEVALDAIRRAAHELNVREQRRPWRDVLPETLTLHEVSTEYDHSDEFTDEEREQQRDDPGRFVMFGLTDDPANQKQVPAIVDLETGGGWLIFGAPGSGKTTLLRTVAASITVAAEPGDLEVLAIDCAGRGLHSLTNLPDVVDVVYGDDREAVTRQLLTLDQLLRDRRRLLGSAGAEHLTAYHRHHERVPRILVLIDGLGSLFASFAPRPGSIDSYSAEEWLDRLQRLFTDGRQVGIHVIATADRRNSIPPVVQTAVTNRLILRQSDEQAYNDLGVSGQRAHRLDLPPGRGLIQGTTTVQVASVTSDTSAQAQSEFLARLTRTRARSQRFSIANEVLPELVTTHELPPNADSWVVWLGRADIDGRPVKMDLSNSDAVIVGPPRSGRSQALLTIATGLASHHDVFVAAPPGSPLAALSETGLCTEVSIGRAEQHVDMLQRLVNLDAMGPSPRGRVLIVDDADVLDDYRLPWPGVANANHLTLVISYVIRTTVSNDVIKRTRFARQLVVLRPEDPNDFNGLTGMRSPVRPGLALPPGRGILVADRAPSVLQLAQVGAPASQ